MLALIRVVIPVVLCTAGILVVILKGVTEESLEIGIPIFSAGASVWLLNFLYRVGVAGDKERDHESEARDYFAEHGRWPDPKPKVGASKEGDR